MDPYDLRTLKLRTLSCTPSLQRPTCPADRYLLSTPLAMTAPSIRSLSVLPSASTRYKCQSLPGLNLAFAIGLGPYGPGRVIRAASRGPPTYPVWPSLHPVVSSYPRTRSA